MCCWSFIVKDGKNIGPALYNVVGRKVGLISDYKYSNALSEYGKEWTFEELNGYLLKPAKWIKGTKMAFAGLKEKISFCNFIFKSKLIILYHYIFLNNIARYF